MSEQAVLLPLIALLPLLAGGLGLLLRRLAPAAVALLGVLGLAGSAVCALAVNAGFSQESTSAAWSIPWIGGQVISGHWNMPEIPLALQLDYTGVLFVLTTALIGIAVLLYAIRERRHDECAGQFHALLAMFAGSMLLFLVSDTLLIMYTAWELMGLFSYLLIRHRGTPEAYRAARQAFWTTRATDFGLLFAIFIMMFGLQRKFLGLHWVRLSDVDLNMLATAMVEQVPAGLLQQELHATCTLLGTAAFLVLLAVLGKAALLPLSFWLPDAMVAPAPVSALLHSATLVAAGPLLFSRLLPQLTLYDQALPGDAGFSGMALAWGAFLGGMTLLIGAVCACCQKQPKRLLAWSTVSQLGLCVLGSSVLAPEAARFLLLGHAWYKAALFLGVGILAAAWHEQHDGNGQGASHEPEFNDLKAQSAMQPLLYWLGLLPAALSLAGLIGLAGFYGKEQILGALLSRSAEAWGSGSLATMLPEMPAWWGAAAWLAMMSIPFTAAYCMRLLAGLHPGGAAAEGGSVANASSGWQLNTGLTVLLASVGSLGMGLFWFAYRNYFESGSATAWGENFAPLSTVLATVLMVAGAVLGLRSMAPGGLAAPTPLLSRVAGAFREGLYLREFFAGFIGGFGEFLAILAGISDIRLIDWLAERLGRGGRGLGVASDWLDIHFVDGLRWWCCEVWWIMRRIHGRYWQNGQIQNYMFVLLLGAVILCLVVLTPLNDSLGNLLGRK